MTLEVRDVIREFRDIGKEATQQFGHLNMEQLNWKPSPDKWSIGQVFDHLITSNSTYFPGLEKIIHNEKKNSFWEKLPLLPKIWGGWLKKAMLPGQGKFKAPKKFKPSSSRIPETIMDDFMQSQEKLIALIEKTESLNRDKIIFTSPVSPIITYSLADIYEILLNHEKRHLLQAQRILEQFSV